MERNETQTLQMDTVEAINSMLEKISVYDGTSFEKSMAAIMKQITGITKVGFISVFRFPPSSESLYPYQVLRWDGRQNKFIERTLEFINNLPFINKWTNALKEKNCLIINYSEADDNEQDFMHSHGIKSLLIVPVFIHGEAWGEIVFQDNEYEQRFGDENIILLRSVSVVLVNSYIRVETERRLTDEIAFNRSMSHDLLRRKKLLSALNETAFRFLAQHERIFSGDLYSDLEMMAGYADIDRVCIWKREYFYNTARYTLFRKWSSTKTDSDISIDEGGVFPFEQFQNWDKIFSENGYIHCLSSELNRTRREIIENYGGGAILIFPFFSQDGLWGTVSFDKFCAEELFKQEDVDTLRYASLMLGSIIVRDEEVRRINEAEDRIKLMLDATPLCCQLWDRHFNLIDCNEAAYRLFDLSSKEEMIERYNEFVPEFQPNGDSSIKRRQESLFKAFTEGGTIYEWSYRLSDGTELPTEITLKRVEYKNGFIVAGYARDLRKIKLLESEAGKIFFDPLTGIYNRRYLDDNLVRILKTLSRSEGTLSIMIVDIDRFKEYNDTYGHSEGDNCLRMVAETLKTGVTRSDDFVARFGGEEFVIVLPNTDKSGACLIAKRLTNSIQERKRPHVGSDINEFVTVSVGVTSGKVTAKRTEQDFIITADDAMYKAKRSGRNRYCFQAMAIL